MDTPTLSRVRIGTRGSQLALAQARWTRAAIEGLGFAAELEIIKTAGDRIVDRPLASVGGKGLFVKEIEEALLRGTADVAVHSMKDLPVDLAPGLVIAAVPVREDPGDLLIARTGGDLSTLPAGARVGTSSVRRAAFLRRLRPDLDVISLRGNVDTRLRKLRDGEFDAIVLAAAGLKRLGLTPSDAVRLDPSVFLPAIGQGALALETRTDAAREIIARLDHAESHVAVTAERAFMRGVGGSCVSPLAAHAVAVGETVVLRAAIISPDGRLVTDGECRGRGADAAQIGAALAAELLGRGGAEILGALGPPV